MKFVGILVIFTVLAYASAGVMPVYDGPTYELTTIDDPTTNDEITPDDESNLPPIRQRRVTCDVLSWQSKWLSVNHSACAIKCLAQRRRGGRCRDGVCVCR